VQTTLLGLGIALIVALVTALVGPIFVDWDRYRPAFEAEAARMVGLPVRIGGAIEVRILPTPSIGLRDVEVGSRAAPVFGARGARAELSLGALMRGEWRAAVLTVEAPEVSLALDASGRIVAVGATPGFDLDRASIDRVVVTGGIAHFYDAASDTRVTLDKLSFSGDMRSLAGQVRGEGDFIAQGQGYRYRLSTGRPADAGMRIRLALEPAERPLTVEIDGMLQMEQGSPRYDGSVTLSRPAGAVLASGKTVTNEPWRITAKARADTHAMLFEQIEAQYGPDERSLRMSGTASLKLGANPQLEAVLSARQIDLDRILVDASAGRRPPLAALRGLGENLAQIGRVAIPLHLGFGVDLVTLSGATLQSVQGDVRSTNEGWIIDNFEVRAPGYTQVALSGQLAGPESAVEFSGPVSVESADPRTLLTWLEGFERTRSAIGPLKLRGDVTVGRDRVAAERIAASFDRKTFEGRMAYVFPRDGAPAKLDAALKAAELDVDGTIAFVTTAFAGSSFVRPGEISLSADIERAIVAEADARSAKVDLHLDGSGLRIDRLSIADFGGAAIDAEGMLDIAATPPRGSLKLAVNATRLDGLMSLAKRFTPEFAPVLERHAALLAPANVEGSLRIDPPAEPSGTRGAAKLALNGSLGKLRVSLSGQARGDMSAPLAVSGNIRAQVSSEDGALLAAAGLDRLVGQVQPAQVTLEAEGPLGGDMRVTLALATEGVDAAATGTLRPFANEAAGHLTLTLSARDLAGLSGGASALPVSLQATLPLGSSPWRLDDLNGRVGDAAVRGKLSLSHAGDWRVDGKITASRLDVPGVVAAAVGAMPDGNAWSGRSFVGLPLPRLRGQIDVEAPQAALTRTTTATKLQSVISFAPGEVSFSDVEAAFGGGTLAGRADFRTTPGGTALNGKFALINGDAAQIIRSGTHAPISGRISSEVEFDGAGSSPAALIAALRGKGTITLENGQIATLDPKAIDAAIRTADRGAPVAVPRIADMVTRTMDDGVLDVPWMSAPIEIATGRARLGKVVMPPQVDDLAVAASLDLVEETLDARFTLYGPKLPQGPVARPEVSVAVKGPIAAPRRSVDVSVLVGWLTLRAVEREAKNLEAEEREARRRERLNTAIRERLEKPPPAPAAGPKPPAAAPLRMPPPPGAARHAPRAGIIESAPLPLVPQ